MKNTLRTFIVKTAAPKTLVPYPDRIIHFHNGEGSIRKYLENRFPNRVILDVTEQNIALYGSV